MNIFEKLRSGAPVDMMAEEYQPVIQELIRANKALYHVNHPAPRKTTKPSGTCSAGSSRRTWACSPRCRSTCLCR